MNQEKDIIEFTKKISVPQWMVKTPVGKIKAPVTATVKANPAMVASKFYQVAASKPNTQKSLKSLPFQSTKHNLPFKISRSRSKNIMPSDLVVLNQKKRDRRSIEEIQLELKKKGKNQNDSQEKVSACCEMKLKEKERNVSEGARTFGNVVVSKESTRAKKSLSNHISLDNIRIRSNTKSSPGSTNGKLTKESCPSSSSNREPRPHSSKMTFESDHLGSEEGGYYNKNYSDIIGKIFGYDRKKYYF